MSTIVEGSSMIDALADSQVATLELYNTHMAAGRYSDARECLSAARTLTEDVIHLEDHVLDFKQDNQGSDVNRDLDRPIPIRSLAVASGE